MRTFVVTLAQNTNGGPGGSTLDVSGAAVELGTWSREAEKDLTKISPSEQTLRLFDLDGTIWAWLQEQIQVTTPAAALYPPWVLIDIDGVRSFTGYAYPRQITHDEASGEISITAQDWSSSLTAKFLGADSPDDDLDPLRNPWLRPYPRAATARGTAVQVANWGPWTNWVGIIQLDYLFWRGPQFVEVGDYVTCDFSPAIPGFPVGNHYRVSSVGQSGYPWISDGWVASFDGLGQDLATYTNRALNMESMTATFTRIAGNTSLRDYYVVTQSVAAGTTGVRVLSLDTVDGLTPGDVLQTIGTTTAHSWTVLQVDAQALQVVTKEDVADVIANVTHLFFSEESLRDLVLDDARLAIKRAVSFNSPDTTPYIVDFSRYVPPTVANPVLVWLPLRAMGSQDLSTVRAMDQGLADFRVYGAGSAAWNGTPESGWVAMTSPSAQAPWSAQLLAAPASLMPNEAATLAPGSPTSDAVLALAIRDTVGYDPSTPSVPAVNLIYDYLQMRRVQIRQDMSISIHPWTGSTWGTLVGATWPGAVPVLSATVFPGSAGSIIGLTSAGLQLVPLPSGTPSNIVAVPQALQDGVLRTTPWGCYLVSSQGYGLITYISGTLALSYVLLSDQVKMFYPTTFAGLNATDLMIMARFDSAADGTTDVVTETHLLRLAAVPPANAQDAVLATEKLLDGAPRTAGALRDGTQPERIIGHCGGRMFVYGRTLPASYALERYTPSGLKAMELIEHVCQVLNAMAVPDPTGCLHIISRGLVEAPIALTVDQVEVVETRVWENFYTVVRVSSAKDEAVLADAWGTPGGDSMEYSQHPFLWTQSGCVAVAESLSSWFGVPRAFRTETWFWTDTDSAAPWESLPPVATVTINEDPRKWIVLGIDDDKPNGEAKVKLVEVF